MIRKGFFSTSTTQDKLPLSLIPQCGSCGLYKTCNSPKMPPSGKGKKKILIVAEAPGQTEDDKGIQLTGNSGRELVRLLSKFDIAMRKDCWLTNSLICHPPGNKITNAHMIDWCRPNLIRTIQELEPEVVILLGKTAMKSLIPYIYNDNIDTMEPWLGWQIPSQKINAWVCPTYHPARLLHEKDPNQVKLLERELSNHLQAACELAGRPWQTVPDYRQGVRVILDPNEASDLILTFAKGGKPVAFDYETNMGKPDSEKHRIVSCSIYDGTTTISYPWHGAAIKATQKFIKSDCRKIASNAKFEERWTYLEFGHGVTNWFWDTMLMAHCLDNRRGITSIKFQAFVQLGQPRWDRHVEPYLKTKSRGAHDTNRVKELELHQLLVYGGLDSLLEFKVAKIQAKQMGVKL